MLDEKHLLRAVRYVERNPVRAGLVKEAQEYSWSSAGFHLGEKEKDELVKSRDLMGLVSDWAGYLKVADEEIEKQLRMATRTGRPLGEGRFLGRLKRLIGRDLRKRKAGRQERIMKIGDMSPEYLSNNAKEILVMEGGILVLTTIDIKGSIPNNHWFWDYFEFKVFQPTELGDYNAAWTRAISWR